MTKSFPAVLDEKLQAGQAPVVVGLDPRLEALPGDLLPEGTAAERILAYYRETLPLLREHVPVVKPNIAFFERFGAAGYGAYEATCHLAHELGLLVIGDVKRGDIGSTAEAYAAAHFALADALTLQPYLGSDALRPFLEPCRSQGKAIFVLVRTSNPSARELQDLETSRGRLCEVVAGLVCSLAEELDPGPGYSAIGAVVGATYSGDLEVLRKLMPRSWLLLPGVGAQGARAEDLLAAFDARGRGALVSQSRGIMQCFSPTNRDWRQRIEAAAQSFAAEVKGVAGS